MGRKHILEVLNLKYIKDLKKNCTKFSKIAYCGGRGMWVGWTFHVRQLVRGVCKNWWKLQITEILVGCVPQIFSLCKHDKGKKLIEKSFHNTKNFFISIQNFSSLMTWSDRAFYFGNFFHNFHNITVPITKQYWTPKFITKTCHTNWTFLVAPWRRL